ncbi:MAG: DUF4395 domain-containing protein [Thiotrichales bacterium]
MKSIFGFGERIDGYEVAVLNEREVRASAGILFLLALISFMNAWLEGDFRPTKIFVIAFLVDFVIRVGVNPRYAPTLILGRFAVRNQAPEYVGARQKRFAWAIALALAVAMFYLVVINSMVGPLNLFICLTCLLLLFFEAAFGICLACKLHSLVFREPAQLCPGGVCAVPARAPVQRIGAAQTAIVLAFAAGMALVVKHFTPPVVEAAQAAEPVPESASGDECAPPEWAVAMGHAEKWKLHHNCN